MVKIYALVVARTPSWVPFLRNIGIWKEHIHALRSIPFEDVKYALVCIFMFSIHFC